MDKGEKQIALDVPSWTSSSKVAFYTRKKIQVLCREAEAANYGYRKEATSSYSF